MANHARRVGQLEYRLFLERAEKRLEIVSLASVEYAARFRDPVWPTVGARDARERHDNEVAARTGAGTAACLGEHLPERRARRGTIALIERGPSQNDESVGAEEVPIRMVGALGRLQPF